MSLFKSIDLIFTKKEKLFLWLIFFGVLIVTILDVVSFATIIPVFDIMIFSRFLVFWGEVSFFLLSTSSPFSSLRPLSLSLSLKEGIK